MVDETLHKPQAAIRRFLHTILTAEDFSIHEADASRPRHIVSELAVGYRLKA